MKKLFLQITLILSLATAQGCVPLLLVGAAGAGGIVWVQGKLEKNFDKTVDELHQASTSGLKSLGIDIIQEENVPHHVKISAKNKEKQKVTVEIEALTERSSNVKIRVG